MEYRSRSHEIAHSYWRAGLCVLPATLQPKKPDVRTWAPFQDKLPTEEDLSVWFAYDRPMCILTGGVSGNLEMLDFDLGGEFFDSWVDRVHREMPEFLDRLVVEQSQSGGMHVVYRCQSPVCGNIKLAVREVATPDDGEVTIQGKTFKPRRKPEGNHAVHLTLIESRGEGGLFVCSPSQGYSLVQGSFTRLPVITEEQREQLLAIAWSLNEYFPPPDATPAAGTPGGRPGDDFNERGDLRALLRRHGWTLARGGDNEYWCRPGKGSGWSATLKDGVFYVFSSNAPPFEPGRGYSPFSVYTLLEHGGHYSRAATALRSDGFGEPDPQGPGKNGLTTGHTPDAPPPRPLSVRDLVAAYPQLREPVIHGLLRRGETMNIISAPKVGKSWLVTGLAVALATGNPWLGTFATERGDVLILDNELHRETSANRIPRVVHAMNVPVDDVGNRIYVQNLRGSLKDIFSLGPYFQSLKAGQFKLIILDAFYRFMPMGNDENDNGTMANIYNHLDSYANHLQCSFVLIHHTSKGNQSGKSLTDVGAGAGSQSRATDTHLVLRPHEQEDVVVLEAAVRSWPPVSPLCLRWAFPVWEPALDLDPSELRQESKRRPVRDPPVEAEAKEPAWTPETFAQTFVSALPKTKVEIVLEGNDRGLNDHQVASLLGKARAKGLIHPWKMHKGRVAYATCPQPPPAPEEDTRSDSECRKRAVLELLRDQPDLDTRDIAERCHVSVRWVQRLRRELDAPMSRGDQV